MPVIVKYVFYQQPEGGRYQPVRDQVITAKLVWTERLNQGRGWPHQQPLKAPFQLVTLNCHVFWNNNNNRGHFYSTKSHRQG